MNNQKIEINADMGEGFDLYTQEHTSALMPYITMVNIACGYHAGDEALMDKTIQLALNHGIAIGAHPGYPDKLGFGRLPMIFSIEDLRDQQVDQIEGLRKIVLRRGGVLHHVKPHGALYHLAMSDNAVAEMFADVIIGIDPNIVLVGMANSALMKAALKHGLSFQQEIFADRRYTESGLLVPRNEPNALITNVEEGIEQISNFIIKHPRDIDTICVHGDNKRSLAFAKAIYQIVQF